MIVLSFDVDGTLECGKHPGPIKLSYVEKLAKQPGIYVGITGNVRALPTDWGHDFLCWTAQGANWKNKKTGETLSLAERARTKSKALNAALYDLLTMKKVEERKCPTSYLHVGDEATDVIAACQAGWGFIAPEDFVKVKGWWKP